MSHLSRVHLIPILQGRPQAEARITGGKNYPDLTGWVRFYQIKEGVIVSAEISGLPLADGPCQERIFGFHIHQGTNCGDSGKEAFPHAMPHYDPNDCEHPYHAGDLPPLFGNHGLAVSAFLTNRFSVKEVLGRVVILHDRPDDFTTQPAGNSGAKIACGVIRPTAGPCGASKRSRFS